MREHQKDFETACLFRSTDLGANGLRKNKDYVFLDATTESMFIGYAMGRRSNVAQLKRYEPDRHIAPGHMSELNEGVLVVADKLTEEQVRRVLRVVAGWPS